MEAIERLYHLTKPIADDRIEELRAQLENLQGNILQGHGREHCACIFLRFKEGKQQEVRQWIKEFAERSDEFPESITSAYNLYHEIKKYGKYRNQKGGMIRNFFLSAEGYKFLKIKLNGKVPLDSMKEAWNRVGDDRNRTTWENGYRKKIHAMVLLAYRDDQTLKMKKDHLCAQLNDLIDVDTEDGEESPGCFVETGEVKRGKHGKVIEHFGYVDGISQPLFFEHDIKRRDESNGKWNPGLRPSLVLVPDLHEGSKQYSGSYLVFRKLEQNVDKFNRLVNKLAELLEKDKKRAEALVIGRFKDGTPVVTSPISKGLALADNNFNYEDDSDGLKCPFHAHIRKVNPRKGLSFKTRPVIVRRGITYDDREEKPQDKAPEKGAGILFMCYQNNIKDHFEFMQREWANSPHKPEGPEQQFPGTDPVIGREKALRQEWPIRWDEEGKVSFPFQDCVTLKGGEYFFAPSIHFLRNLVTGSPGGNANELRDLGMAL